MSRRAEQRAGCRSVPWNASLQGHTASRGRRLQLLDTRELEGDVVCYFLIYEDLPSSLSVSIVGDIPPPNALWCIPSLFSHALQGYIGPGKEQVLKVYYLPGAPGIFCRTFQIQVGHLEPAEISLKGEGIFPRIYLDLPRSIKGEHCLSTPREGPPVFPPMAYACRAAHTHIHQAWGFRGCQTNTQPSGCFLNF